jgi:hypothetical protein
MKIQNSINFYNLNIIFKPLFNNLNIQFKHEI